MSAADNEWRVHLSRECPTCRDGEKFVELPVEGQPDLVVGCPDCLGLKTQFDVIGLEEFRRLLGLPWSL